MTVADQALTAVQNEDNPWPGLSPFDEATQRFFNGRREEAAALRRLLMQAPLTTLFGKSGLGKTSLLKAGLFPLVRAERILPIYVRLSIAVDAGSLIDQVAEALAAELDVRKIQAAPRAPDETLWRYLHRTDVELRDDRGQLLTPLFVLDQFEEIFTLGAAAPAAVAQLRVDLADLVENRIPAPLAARIETDEDAHHDLSLTRQAYRTLISFREDFLPAIEGWKRDLPSLTRNRLRLLPMSGAQAFEAVHRTAPHLVDRDLAKEIVTFVAAAQGTDEATTPAAGVERPAGSAAGAPAPGDQDELVVEPALLSLLCHGLNRKRREQGKATFDRELLQGAGEAIIDDFYRECVVDLPEHVQRFIENELITERGFRKVCAIDDATTAHGVAERDIRTLVDRRLLRVEPSQGIERVELTHDVLTGVVRRHRERQRESERQAEEQVTERRRADARRMRLLRVGVLVLLLLVIGVGWLAWWAFDQKRAAEEERGKAHAAARTSLAREIAGTAGGRLALDPELGALLALESLKTAPTAQGESVLRQALLRVQRVLLRGSSGQVGALQYSPDGRWLLGIGDDGRLRVWEPAEGALVREIGERGAAIVDARFGGDGQTVTTLDRTGRLRTWTTAGEPAGEVRINVPRPAGGARRVSFELVLSPDLRSVASSSSDAVQVWNAQTGTLIRTIPDSSEVVHIGFSPDGRLVTGWADGVTIAWDSASGKQVFGRKELNDQRVIVVSSDGTRLVTGGGKLVKGRDQSAIGGPGDTLGRVWDVQTGRLLRELRGHTFAIRAAAYSRDGKLVATAGEDGTLRVWDASTGVQKHLFQVAPAVLTSVTFSPDATSVAAGADEGTVRLWRLGSVPLRQLGGGAALTSAAFSADGRWLAAGDTRGDVALWELSGQRARRWKSHRSMVLAVAFTPDARQLISAGGNLFAPGKPSDNAIRLWQVDGGALVHEFVGSKATVTAVAFSPDGRRLVTTGSEDAVRIWGVDTGTPVGELRGGSGALGVAYSPDGRLIAVAGTDGTVRLWRDMGPAPVSELPAGKGILSSVAFSGDGKRLAAISIADNNLRIWQLDARVPPQQINAYAPSNAGDLSRDGAFIANAGTDGLSRIWEVATGNLLLELPGPNGDWAAVFSPDGRLIATAGQDGVARVWTCEVCAPFAELRELANKRIVRTLTDEERRQYLGHSPLADASLPARRP